MSNNIPNQEWTDWERSMLASYLLNSATYLEQFTAENHAELLEIIHSAHAVLTLPEEELKALHEKIHRYVDKLNQR